MYTVKELIEALKQCPEDYVVLIDGGETCKNIEMVGIAHESKVVDLLG